MTDEDYECSPETVESTYEVNGFRPTAHKRFIIEYEGAKNEYGDGNITIDESFSGEVTYCAEYELDDTPKADETYQIRLEGFSSTVLVKIGEFKIPLGMTPMTAKLDGRSLKKSGVISVTVANTALNELYAKTEIVNSFPKAEIGPYQDKIADLEIRRPKLKLGRVFIEKLKF